MIYRIFIGFDPRQCVSFNVCQFSILRRASKPISITPMVIETLPIGRAGLTPFTYSRFLIPYLMGFKGWALWLDPDILVWEDPLRIFDYADPSKAVIVAEGVKPFERAAVMLFNCSHPDNRALTPEAVEAADDLHRIGWTEPGYFPHRWNHCVGYSEPSEDIGLIHYTMGVPAFAETRDCEHQEKWVAELRLMNSVKSWAELMGNSVHAIQTPDGPQPAYKAAKWDLPTTPI